MNDSPVQDYTPRHYRFVKVRDQTIIANDAHSGNTCAFITACFAFCSADVKRQLADWFNRRPSHTIRFEFGDVSVIVTDRVLPRWQREIIQRSNRKSRKKLASVHRRETR